MEFHFYPSFSIAEEHYGNAILSRFPLRVVKTGTLPGQRGLETRGMLWVEVMWNNRPVQVLGTHLGLRRHERRAQMADIVGDQWLAHPGCQPPVIFCADLNARPGSHIYRTMRQALHDTAQSQDTSARTPTWMGVATVDYIFASSEWNVLNRTIPLTYLTRKASDHRPVIVDLSLAS
jgi:endonuclease/exonuclease/phosphatase family metal-dependent hydrolase